MGHSHILPPAAGARLSALDPCELGRPIHALDSLFQLTQQDLDHGLATAFPGRVGAPVRLGGVSHGRSTPIETPLRWASYHSHLGRSAFAIERSALTALLARRYGSSDWALGARCVPALETATEQRLAAQLGQVLTEALVHRIGGGSAAEGDPSPRLEQNLSSARCPISGPVMFLWAQVLAGAEPLGLVVFALDSDTLAAALRQLAHAPPGRGPPGRQRRPAPCAAAAPGRAPRAEDLAPGRAARPAARRRAPHPAGKRHRAHPGQARAQGPGGRAQGPPVPDPTAGSLTMSIDSPALDALSAAPGGDDAFAAVMQEMASAGQAETAPPAPAAAAALGLGRLMRRIPVTLTLELGSAEVSLEDVAQLRPDSVVELDVLAGEPLTMKINGVAIGKAEVVVSGENYGLKVLEVSGLDLDSFAP